ncbi:MAG: 50S ribosomal protein L9 [Parcubacteria group bacterium CG11_big_fil_rev_8_21_14_0_20_41_14]|nr:MAG: 50S ribosomal protein L9 [Parcubacteria group bacterium CG11_big_fil_rev_8_21_14_0_20_41_14]
MKVILTKQVLKLGGIGDVVSVAPGYGRNFLIANGLAKEATEQAIKEVENTRARAHRKKEVVDKKRTKLRNVLENARILVRSAANEEGHLFGGVGAKEITIAIAKRKKIEIDEKSIDLAHRIKNIGEHEVYFNIGKGEKIKFIVDIQKT